MEILTRKELQRLIINIVDIAADIATSTFNNGIIALLKIMQAIKINIGVNDELLWKIVGA